jgi:hypothetical protein
MTEEKPKEFGSKVQKLAVNTEKKTTQRSANLSRKQKLINLLALPLTSPTAKTAKCSQFAAPGWYHLFLHA